MLGKANQTLDIPVTWAYPGRVISSCPVRHTGPSPLRSNSIEPKEVRHASHTPPYRHSRQLRHLVYSRIFGRLRLNDRRFWSSCRHLVRVRRNPALAVPYICGSRGSPGRCHLGPGRHPQPPTEVGAVTEVAAPPARLTHGRQGSLRGPQHVSHSSPSSTKCRCPTWTLARLQALERA